MCAEKFITSMVLPFFHEEQVQNLVTSQELNFIVKVQPNKHMHDKSLIF